MSALAVAAQQRARPWRLAPAGRRHHQQQQPQQPRHHPPQLAEAPVSGRRRLLSLAVPLLFLPWRGCDQGGSYSTGVAGNHGDNCQEIYQPAAAAERRFAEKQRQAASAAPPVVTTPPARLPAAETAREERATLLKEQATYERAMMAAEQAERTQRLVDGMWQSLE